MKIDLERQMDKCRQVTADVVAGCATLEQLCIDTRGLLFMVQVLMVSMSSVLTDDMRASVRRVLVDAGEAAKARVAAETELTSAEEGSAQRVIDRVEKFDAACQEMKPGVDAAYGAPGTVAS